MIIPEDLSAIDMVQELVETTGWNFARASEHLLTFDYDGDWGDYTFAVAEYIGQTECLIQCSLPFTLSPPDTKKKKKRARAKAAVAVQKQTIGQLLELFNLIHDAASLGQFSYRKKSELAIMVNWAYRLPVSDMPDEAVLERVLNEALLEIDEFYPALMLVLSGTVNAEEAYKNAIPEHYGTA